MLNDVIAAADEAIGKCIRGDPSDILRLYGIEEFLNSFRERVSDPSDRIKLDLTIRRVLRAEMDLLKHG